MLQKGHMEGLGWFFYLPTAISLESFIVIFQKSHMEGIGFFFTYPLLRCSASWLDWMKILTKSWIHTLRLQHLQKPLQALVFLRLFQLPHQPPLCCKEHSFETCEDVCWLPSEIQQAARLPKKGDPEFSSPMSLEQVVEAFENWDVYPEIDQW